jgi:hypothetical protein
MAISRFISSTIFNGFPKYEKFWDQKTLKDTDPFGDGSQIMYYSLDGNANASVGGLNLSTAGTVTYSTGKYGSAAYYNGGDNSLWSDSNTLMSGNGARSYSCWVWTNAGATGRQLAVGMGSFSPNQANFDLEVNSYHAGTVSDSYGVHWWGNGLKFLSAAVLYDQWVHLVLVHDGGSSGVISPSNTRLYLNGVSKTLSSDSASPSPVFNISSTNKFRIGTRYYSGTDLQFNGRIDQVRVFNKALSSTEADSLYSGGR